MDNYQAIMIGLFIVAIILLSTCVFLLAFGVEYEEQVILPLPQFNNTLPNESADDNVICCKQFGP